MTVQSLQTPESAPLGAETPKRFPCSAAQQRFYFVEAVSPGNPALNVALRWHINGPLSSATIEKAFGVIIERHEALRTRIVEEDGSPLQEVTPQLSVKPSEIDLTALPLERRDSEALRLGHLEAQKPFDLAALPLLRVTVIRLATDRSLLLVTVHHIAFDAWSIRLLSQEFGIVASALEAGEKPSLPDLQLQYGDYATWQQAYLASGACERDSAYWCRHLAGAPYFEVHGDRERPSQPTHSSEIVATLLPGELSEALALTLKRLETTRFAFGCATVAATLHRYTGSTDICIGTQVSTRDDTDLEPLIGAFVNTLVLRFDASGDPTLTEYIGRVQRTVQDALTHRLTPFHTLVELLKPKRDPRRTPLVSVNFTVLQHVTEDARYNGFELSGIPSLSAGRLHDLNFFMVHWPAIGWRMALEYDSELFDRATAERLLAEWASMVRWAVVEPHSKPLASAPDPTLGDSADARKLAPPRAHVALPPNPSIRHAEIENGVIDLWKEVLGIETLDLGSNFFDCGGHSLLALRMLSRAAARFGRRIGVSSLLSAPTAREFAKCISADPRELESWKIVPIQPGGSRTPIFAINNTILYYNLSRKIGADHPFYSLQMFNPDDPAELPERDFEDIASDYVRLIRTVRPHGPYILIGLCLAGTIAYETAQQLRRAGEDVPLVVMADNLRPGFTAQLPPLRALMCRMAYRWNVAKHHLHALREGSETLSSVLHSYSLIRRTSVFFRLIRHVDGRGLRHEDWANRWFLPHLQRACARYVARPTRDLLMVLASDELAPVFAGESLGWGPLAEGGIISRHVPGWHSAIFGDPGVEMIAESLRPLLAKVDEYGPVGNRREESASGVDTARSSRALPAAATE